MPKRGKSTMGNKDVIAIGSASVVQYVDITIVTNAQYEAY